MSALCPSSPQSMLPLPCRFQWSACASPAHTGQPFGVRDTNSSCRYLEASNACRTDLGVWASQTVLLLWPSGLYFGLGRHDRKPEDGGFRFLRNVVTNRQKYTASHPTRPSFRASVPSYVKQYDRLCGLVVSVSGYRSRGPVFDSRRFQIFWEAVGLERGPLSLVRTTEELTGIKSSGSGLENRE
jgi:hypothetical protein